MKFFQIIETILTVIKVAFIALIVAGAVKLVYVAYTTPDTTEPRVVTLEEIYESIPEDDRMDWLDMHPDFQP